MKLKRYFDLLFAVVILSLTVLPIVLVALLVKLTSKGPVLYWSDRIGKNNKIFKMPKFRSMQIDTPAVATHLLNNPNDYLTPVGSLLRRSSLDELPQIWCILKGEMSWVGPRPALFNQDDLIELRTKKGIDKLTPGLTGWAQVNGRDELPIPEKVALDEAYLARQSFLFDMQIIGRTICHAIWGNGVKH